MWRRALTDSFSNFVVTKLFQEPARAGSDIDRTPGVQPLI